MPFPYNKDTSPKIRKYHDVKWEFSLPPTCAESPRRFSPIIINEVPVYFVTDGFGSNQISLGTSNFAYYRGPVAYYMLIHYIKSTKKFERDCDFFAFTDSDAYVNLQNLQDALMLEDKFDPKFYSGYIWTTGGLDFVHGTLMIFSRSSFYSIDFEVCRKDHWWGYFDIESAMCLRYLGDIVPQRREKWNFIVDNINGVRKTYLSSSSDDIACAIAFHKVLHVNLTYEIHMKIQETQNNLSCSYY